MYVVHPYNQEHYDKAKSALNAYSQKELQDAVKTDEKLLREVLEKTFKSSNNYLFQSLTKFVDDLIEGDYLIRGDNKPGNLVEKGIKEIYNLEVEDPTDEQANKIARLEEIERTLGLNNHTVGTSGTDLLEAKEESLLVELDSLKDIAELRDKVKIQNLDLKSKSLEKAILMKLFHDTARKKKISSPHNVKIEEIESPSANWQYAADSFVGCHTLGVNSDSHSASEKSKSLLGVIADGATISFSESELSGRKISEVLSNDPKTTLANLKCFGGHSLAKSLTEGIAKFPFDAFLKKQTSNATTAAEEKDKKLFYRNLPKIFKDPNFNFDPQANTGFVEQYSEYLKTNGSKLDDASNTIELLKDPEINLVTTALAPLIMIESQIKDSFQETYEDTNLDLSTSASLNYSLELGNKIVLVRVGDADIAAYDTKGMKLTPEKEMGISDRGYSRYSNPLHHSPDFTGGKVSYEHHKVEDPYDPYFSVAVKIFDKDKVKTIVQVSDGAVKNPDTKSLPEKINPDIKTTFSKLCQVVPPKVNSTNPDYDDKTIMIFQRKDDKASAS